MASKCEHRCGNCGQNQDYVADSYGNAGENGDKITQRVIAKKAPGLAFAEEEVRAQLFILRRTLSRQNRLL